MTSTAYSEKLKDPRWQRKRLEIFQRDDFKCVVCDDGTRTLHVHHEEYKGNPWDAPSESLRTLCERCHERFHFFNAPLVELQRDFINGLSEEDARFQLYWIGCSFSFTGKKWKEKFAKFGHPIVSPSKDSEEFTTTTTTDHSSRPVNMPGAVRTQTDASAGACVINSTAKSSEGLQHQGSTD